MLCQLRLTPTILDTIRNVDASAESSQRQQDFDGAAVATSCRFGVDLAATWVGRDVIVVLPYAAAPIPAALAAENVPIAEVQLVAQRGEGAFHAVLVSLQQTPEGGATATLRLWAEDRPRLVSAVPCSVVWLLEEACRPGWLEHAARAGQLHTLVPVEVHLPLSLRGMRPNQAAARATAAAAAGDGSQVDGVLTGGHLEAAKDGGKGSKRSHHEAVGSFPSSVVWKRRKPSRMAEAAGTRMTTRSSSQMLPTVQEEGEGEDVREFKETKETADELRRTEAGPFAASVLTVSRPPPRHGAFFLTIRMPLLPLLCLAHHCGDSALRAAVASASPWETVAAYWAAANSSGISTRLSSILSPQPSSLHDSLSCSVALDGGEGGLVGLVDESSIAWLPSFPGEAHLSTLAQGIVESLIAGEGPKKLAARLSTAVACSHAQHLAARAGYVTRDEAVALLLGFQGAFPKIPEHTVGLIKSVLQGR